MNKTVRQIALETMQAGSQNGDLEKVALAAAILAIDQCQGNDEAIADALDAVTDFSAVIS